MSLDQLSAKVEDGMLIQGAFSLAGNSGGGGIEGSSEPLGVVVELPFDRLKEKKKEHNLAIL